MDPCELGIGMRFYENAKPKSPSDLVEQSRTGHFAGEAILAGQSADLEEPGDAVVLRVSDTADEIVGDVLGKLKLGQRREQWAGAGIRLLLGVIDVGSCKCPDRS